MRLPEKSAKQRERTQYKNRFADWIRRIAAYYESNEVADPQRSLQGILREGVDLLNAIMEKGHKALLESRPTESDSTYAAEFKVCLKDLVAECRHATEQMPGYSFDTENSIAHVYDAVERLDSYLKS